MKIKSLPKPKPSTLAIDRQTLRHAHVLLQAYRDELRDQLNMYDKPGLATRIVDIKETLTALAEILDR
jgi:hypothetical protein